MKTITFRGFFAATLFLFGGVSSSYAQDAVDYDPLEGINRDIYNFNAFADRYLTRPIALGYRKVLPDPVERGVGRFFDNLGELSSAVNNLAQGKGYSSASNTGRFLINSTVGIAGIFDVADNIGLDKQDSEDFGQTLATWGVGSGPYLVLPFLGPSTLRDAPSRLVDRYFDPLTYLDDVPARNTLRVVNIVDIRAGLLDLEQALPEKDPYIFVRDAYLQRREYQILDGEVIDDFGSDGFDDFLD